MVAAEACLGRCMQLLLLSKVCEAAVDHRHEGLGKRRCNGYTTIVVHVLGVPTPLKQWNNFGTTPRSRCKISNSADIQKLCKTLNASTTQVLQ